MIPAILIVVMELALCFSIFKYGELVEHNKAAVQLNHAMQASERQYAEQEQEVQRLSQQWEESQREQHDIAEGLEQRARVLAQKPGNQSACLGPDELRLIGNALRGEPAASP